MIGIQGQFTETKRDVARRKKKEKMPENEKTMGEVSEEKQDNAI